MTFLAVLLLGQSPIIVKPDQFLTFSQAAVSSGTQSRVEELFQRKEDATYLFNMASRSGGLRNVKVAVIPAPPGWEDTGPFWAVFHAKQEIEQDHDPVYPILRTTNGLKIGKEMPEWAGHETQVSSASVDAHVVPQGSKVTIRAIVNLDGKKTTRAAILRLNDFYRVSTAAMADVDAKVVDANTSVPTPEEGDVVRAGSLLIPWTKKPAQKLEFKYDGVVQSDNQDKINDKQVYLTAWWVPSIARLPFTTTVRVTGPKEWVLKSEGPQIPSATDGLGPLPAAQDNEQTLSFHCQIPISYPKIIGGAYTLAAEANVDGKQFRSYQLDPVDKARGQQEVNLMIDAMRFYEKNLGPFPFDHYWCFDSVGYYGIESYSHTLLQKGYTLRFVSHEMGHTYFGGIVPSAYAKDTWNEGVTQYIDSIAFQNNIDRTLEAGIRTVGLNVPLTNMSVTYEYASATYWRGAYVMKMLEAEIGRDKVLEGLRALIKDREGKDTTWPDLRPYFEKAGGEKLDWYWNQWISNATFPTLEITDSEPIKIETKYKTRVTVKQSGTADPFRLKFMVRVRRGPQKVEQLVSMNSPQATFQIESDFEPTSSEIDVFPYTLATVVKR